MIRALRLCRTPYTYEKSGFSFQDSLTAQHARLDSLLRQFLSASIASTFAEGVLAEDGHTLEWYSDLSGQPIPFASATPVTRTRARAILDERLSAVRSLAERLQQNGAAADATLLQTAAMAPDAESIWLVGEHPVVIHWGMPRKTPLHVPLPVSRSKPRYGFYLGLGLVAGLLALFGAWWLFFSPSVPTPVVATIPPASPPPEEGIRKETPIPVPDLAPLRQRIAQLENELTQRLRQCAVSLPPVTAEVVEPPTKLLPSKPPLPKPEPRPSDLNPPDPKPKPPAKPKAQPDKAVAPATPDKGSCKGQKTRVSAGPIWNDGHAQKRCPEIAREWTQKNSGKTARWTGDWVTTQWAKESVCEICITSP